MDAGITLNVDGEVYHLTVGTSTTLLDALRDRLGNTSPKKGCDHGQCGACTVLVGGRRVLACLILAATVDGAEVTTAAGLADGDTPHPVQQAFLGHDTFQCGYCTPGQICSAVGMLDEFAAGWPSHASEDLTAPPRMTRAEIAERMAGNLCRCAAYVNIVTAFEQAAEATEAALHAADLVEIAYSPAPHDVALSADRTDLYKPEKVNPSYETDTAAGDVDAALAAADVAVEQTYTTAMYHNHDLAEYHIATCADVTDIEATWLDEHDPHVNPVGSKGIGEIGIVGTAAAVANAVHHATGVRVRDLPITLDKLLAAW